MAVNSAPELREKVQTGCTCTNVSCFPSAPHVVHACSTPRLYALYHYAHLYNASRVFKICSVQTLIFSQTVVAVHRALTYLKNKAVHRAPELCSKVQVRSTVHSCKPSAHLGHVVCLNKTL